MTAQCAHPSCRTSLDEYPTECPHGLPFCESCTWEEVCSECADPAPRHRAADATDAEAVGRAFDTLLAPAPPVALREHTECRCGWPDRSQLGYPPKRVPVVDMTATPGLFAIDLTPIRRTCRACEHPILPARPGVSHRPLDGHAVRNFYHLECVEIP